MSEISFGLSEVHEWASFSNDFNPIHFDLKKAQRAGLGGLVVHGMLALLPVKVAVAHRYANPEPPANSNPWIKFHALFRSPIPHDAASRLTIQPSNTNGLNFRLNCKDQGRERFRGSMSPSDDQGAWLQAHPLPSSAFLSLRTDDGVRFVASYPDVKENWIALDAVVFSDFMRSRLGQIASTVQQRLLAMMGDTSTIGLFVQSSHTVYVDVQATRTLGSLPIDCARLKYGMRPPDLVLSRDKLIGSVSLPVLLDDKFIMLIEIGLLAKPSPPVP